MSLHESMHIQLCLSQCLHIVTRYHNTNLASLEATICCDHDFLVHIYTRPMVKIINLKE